MKRFMDAKCTHNCPGVHPFIGSHKMWKGFDKTSASFQSETHLPKFNSSSNKQTYAPFDSFDIEDTNGKFKYGISGITETIYENDYLAWEETLLWV